MALPAIRYDPITGLGNGRTQRVVIRRLADSPLVLTCWTPDTLTVQQFAGVVKASLHDARWHGIEERLAHANELPSASRRGPLSAEMMEFLQQMAGGATSTAGSGVSKGSAATLNAGRLERGSLTRIPTPIRPPGEQQPKASVQCITNDAGCECDWATVTYYYLDATYTDDAWVCIDLEFGDDDWSIDLSFFLDVNYLTDDDYGYLLDNNELGSSTYDCSGTSIPNQVDSIRNQYTTYGQAIRPPCNAFTFQPGTTNFPWPKVQSHESRHWDYAIFKTSLSSNLETLYAETTFTIDPVRNRIYSTPAKNSTIAGAAQNSQHVYGDAADIDVPDSANWQNLRNKAYFVSPRPCSEPWTASHTHLHIDFRIASDRIYSVTGDACPTSYTIPHP